MIVFVFNIYLSLFFFWLCWVLVVAHGIFIETCGSFVGFSLVVACGGPQAVSLFSFLLSRELLVYFLVCTPDTAVLSVKKENGLQPVSFQVPALDLRAPGCSPEEGRAALRGKSVSPKNGP